MNVFFSLSRRHRGSVASVFPCLTRSGWKRRASILAVGIMAAALGACNGSTGPQGPQGPAGPPGPTVESADNALALHLTITGASIDATSTVAFKATDPDRDNELVTGIPASTLEVIIAKLIPGTNGDADHWQNYINHTVQPYGSGQQPEVQPETDSGGSLADHGDGTYTYTFGTKLTAVTDPVKVTYDPSEVHRIAINIRSSTLPSANNAIYTWIPATGQTSGFDSREIVTISSCNQCHDELALHGGPRKNTDECVLCHNPGNTSLNGESLDFKVMIHKIHDASNLPSVLSGIPYILIGYRGSENDFSDVVFPQNIRNCTKCHDPANPETPQAIRFATRPTMAACGSCHDNVDFAQGKAGGHPGGVETDNSQCTVCHTAGSVAGSVQESHVIPQKVAAANYQYNILTVDNSGPGQSPVITFSVTNPNNNDQPYDLATDPAFTSGSARLAIDIGWTFPGYPNEYSNFGSGTNPGQPVQINVESGGTLHAQDNGDGTYTVTSPVPIPASAVGTGVVAMEGHPNGDYDGSGNYATAIPVTSAVKYVSITDPTPVPPVAPAQIVDFATRCEKCHSHNDGLAMHGANRVDNLKICVICHNPNATDLSERPTDPDQVSNRVNTAAVDGLEQQAIDFKRHIHAIHGASVRTVPWIIYGYGNSVNNFSDVRFPGIINDCNQCHINNGYQVPLPGGVMGTTIDTLATVAQSSPYGTQDFFGTTKGVPTDAADQTAYERITPTASVCSACHTSTLAKAHMEQNGASFYIQQSMIGPNDAVEACAVCHGAGKIADVSQVHHVRQH